MRPPEFAPEEIIAAGEALRAAGRNVTGFALRQKVGGGNPNRLKQVWEEHQARQSAAQAQPVAELPVEIAEEVAAVSRNLAERVEALAKELNDKAVRAAERRVAEVIRTAGEQREQAERELADAGQTVEDLEKRLKAKESEAAALTGRLTDAQNLAQGQSLELAQLRERLAAEEKAGQELRSRIEEARSQAADLGRRLADAQAVAEAQALETAQLKERLAAAEKAAERTASEHASEIARLTATIERERQRFEESTEKLRAELDRRQAELAMVRADAKAAEQVHQDDRQRAAKEVHRQAERVIKAETERDELRKATAAAREESAALRGRMEALQAHVTELTRTLAAQQASTPAGQKAPSSLGKKPE